MTNNIYINGASNESSSVLEIKIPEYQCSNALVISKVINTDIKECISI